MGLISGGKTSAKTSQDTEPYPTYWMKKKYTHKLEKIVWKAFTSRLSHFVPFKKIRTWAHCGKTQHFVQKIRSIFTVKIQHWKRFHENWFFGQKFGFCHSVREGEDTHCCQKSIFLPKTQLILFWLFFLNAKKSNIF